jgi:hypothetical protein
LDAVQEFPAIDWDVGRSFDPKSHMAFRHVDYVDGYAVTRQDNLLADRSSEHEHSGILSERCYALSPKLTSATL